MRRPEPITRTVEITEAQNQLLPLANQVSRNEVRVIVAESGAPIAALISIDDLDRLAQMERERAARFAVIDRLRAAFADVPAEEIEREVANAVAEVRAEMAAERHARAKNG